MSLICDYVRVNPNWLEELSSSPYYLTITRANHFVKFEQTSYSDTKIPLVAEACGLTIDLNGLVPVCWEVPYMSSDCVLVWRDGEGFWQVSDRVNILSPKREKLKNEYGLNFSTLNPDYIHVYIIEPEGLEEIHRIEPKTGRFLRRKEERSLVMEIPGTPRRMEELKTMIENTKYAVEHNTRYKRFTILETPKMFKELFKDKDIELVQVHTAERINNTNDIVGFCGIFQWKDNEIIPLDYDVYKAETIVYAYSWFSSKRDEHLDALDIIVGNDW